MTQTFFKRNWTDYLIDPGTYAALIERDGGISPVDQPEKVYPVIEGVICLMTPPPPPEVEHYDAERAREGREAPDEFTFRMLPREGLPGWIPGDSAHWKKRSLSTATMWHFLEEQRRAKGKLPIGFQGIAADLSDGLPYAGYGLDVGGFVTVAVSPNAGRYGMGAYPYSRYGRVQAEWGALPLKPNLFDLVVCSGSIPQVPADKLPAFLDHAAAALKKDGHLIITDAPDTDKITAMLTDLGLKVQARIVKDEEPEWGDRLRRWRGKKLDVPPLLIGKF